MRSFKIRVGGDGVPRHNLMIASHSNPSTLSVFSGLQLSWSAVLPYIPADLQVVSSGNVKGLIAALAYQDASPLSVLYLGTTPLSNKPSEDASMGMIGGDVSLTTVESELKQFNKQIALLEKKTVATTAVPVKNVFPLTTVSPFTVVMHEGLAFASATMTVVNQSEKSIIMNKFIARVPAYTDLVLLERLPEHGVLIEAFEDLSYNPAPVTIEARSSIEWVLLCKCPSVSHNTDLGMNVYYEVTCAVPEDVSLTGRACLPLGLFMHPVSDSPSGAYKLTLEWPGRSINLSSTLASMIQQYSLSKDIGNAIGFGWNARYVQEKSSAYADEDAQVAIDYGLTPVYILLSKTGSKLRFQSDTFYSLWMVVEYVSGLVSAECGAAVFADPIPLKDLLTELDTYVSLHTKCVALRSSLNDCAAQWRLVQKKVLGNLMSATTQSKSSDREDDLANLGLELVQDDCMEDMKRIGAELVENENRLHASCIHLGSVCKVVATLTMIKYSLTSEKDRELVSSILDSDGLGDVEANQGWIDRREAALSWVIKCAFTADAEWSPPKLSSDGSRLRKLFISFFDKLEKGARFVRT